MYSSSHILRRAELYKKLSLLVDQIDEYRPKVLNRLTDKKLNTLYLNADILVGKLKRSGSI
jgi:hypothetical protein